MNGYYNQIIDALKAAGFYYLRQGKGSHELWSNGSHTQIVPFNCQSRHTANGIMKACKITTKF